MWARDSSGVLSCKPFLTCLSFFVLPPLPIFKSPCKLKMPLKVRAFVWALELGTINTSDMCQRRRPGVAIYPSIFVMCSGSSEHVRIYSFIIMLLDSFGVGSLGNLGVYRVLFQGQSFCIFVQDKEEYENLLSPSFPWIFFGTGKQLYFFISSRFVGILYITFCRIFFSFSLHHFVIPNNMALLN